MNIKKITDSANFHYRESSSTYPKNIVVYNWDNEEVDAFTAESAEEEKELLSTYPGIEKQ